MWFSIAANAAFSQILQCWLAKPRGARYPFSGHPRSKTPARPSPIDLGRKARDSAARSAPREEMLSMKLGLLRRNRGRDADGTEK